MEGLKIHLQNNHEAECDICNQKFAGKKRLENHKCRIHVRNPSFGALYMKDWFLKNDCIRIFCENEKCEVSILHSDLCIESKACNQLPNSFKHPYTYNEEDKILHQPFSEVFSDGEVNWCIVSANIG